MGDENFGRVGHLVADLVGRSWPEAAAACEQTLRIAPERRHAPVIHAQPDDPNLSWGAILRFGGQRVVTALAVICHKSPPQLSSKPVCLPL
jgi:hypothetical protein